MIIMFILLVKICYASLCCLCCCSCHLGTQPCHLPEEAAHLRPGPTTHHSHHWESARQEQRGSGITSWLLCKEQHVKSRVICHRHGCVLFREWSARVMIVDHTDDDSVRIKQPCPVHTSVLCELMSQTFVCLNMDVTQESAQHACTEYARSRMCIGHSGSQDFGWCCELSAMTRGSATWLDEMRQDPLLPSG